MATGKDKYVTRLMKVKCSCGSMENYLNIPKDHGVIFSSPDSPVMNANDHEPDKNIVHFGRCNSSMNPRNAAMNTVSAISSVMPCSVLGSTILKNLKDKAGCKCKPMTITPWNNVKEGYATDGAPAITTESTLTCYYGGFIEITQEQAQGENPEDSEQTIEQKGYNALNKMPAGMAEKIADYCDMEYEATQAQQDSQSDAQAAGLDYMANPFASLFVSKETSDANYLHNLAQTIPPEALDERGNIINQGLLTNFRMGNISLAEMGCGCIATYNALNILGAEPNLADIIRYFENQPQWSGVMLGGNAGVSVFGISGYLTEQGYDVSYSLCEDSIDEAAQNADVNIIGYAGIKNATGNDFGHFVAFEKDGADTYRFYNDSYGKKNDVRTMDEFLGKSTELQIVTSVKKKTTKSKKKENNT